MADKPEPNEKRADRCPVKANRSKPAFAKTRYLTKDKTPHINSVPMMGRHWAAYN